LDSEAPFGSWRYSEYLRFPKSKRFCDCSRIRIGHRNKILVPIAFGRTSKNACSSIKVSTQPDREGKHIPSSGRDSGSDSIHQNGNSMTCHSVSQVIFWRLLVARMELKAFPERGRCFEVGGWSFEASALRMEKKARTSFPASRGLSWRYYAPIPNSIWSAPNAMRHMCQPRNENGEFVCTGEAWRHVVIPSKQFLTDIRSGSLSAVTWITPAGQYSDHPGLSKATGGPSWVASIVNAIGNSPFWTNTAIIVTWDDGVGGTIMYRRQRSSMIAKVGDRDMCMASACR
jgi:hypothetical protein